MDQDRATKECFERQLEVLDAIKERTGKGDAYAMHVARTASTLSLIWAVKAHNEPETHELLDWAAECVLLVGAGQTAAHDQLDKDASVKHLQDFTADVQSVSRHQFLKQGE